MVWYRGGIYLRKKWLAAAIVLLALCSAGFAEEARNITKECRFWVSEGSAYNISNSSLASSWKPEGAEPEMRIMLPDGGVAACVQIDWRRAPEEYTLTEYDANQTPFFTHTAAEDSFPCLSQLYEPNSNAKYISIKFTTPEQGISRIRVFSAGELPNTVVRWEPPCEKADLLVVSAHQDDEWLWFGGIIPYYDLVRDKNVQVVYMAKGGRLRYGEALNGLAVAGVRTYPHFIGLKDKHDSSLEAAVKTWTSMDHILNVLVEVIRRYKPAAPAHLSRHGVRHRGRRRSRPVFGFRRAVRRVAGEEAVPPPGREMPDRVRLARRLPGIRRQDGPASRHGFHERACLPASILSGAGSRQI